MLVSGCRVASAYRVFWAERIVRSLCPGLAVEVACLELYKTPVTHMPIYLSVCSVVGIPFLRIVF